MQTVPFANLGIQVSRLGFGAMRLPVEEKNGKQAIRRPEAVAMLRHGIDEGITYVDTAYPYHDGESELLVGEALQGGYRRKVLLATKLPVWLVEKREDMDRLLEEQLRKLQTDYLDFYLLHAMNRKRLEMLKQLEYPAFLEKAVASGKIRFPAFSFHDDVDAFRDIVDDYPWRMAQIQLNLLDGSYQAGLEGARYAAAKGIGVVVMEPLRGGALATPPPQVQALYDAFPLRRSGVEWAFRCLYDMPEVTTILSGMSTMAQLQDNLRIFRAAAPGVITPEEAALLHEAKALYLSRIKTHCTGCGYCQPCPVNVAIPHIFQEYDSALMLDRMADFSAGYRDLEEEGRDGGRCISCGQCEAACPQQLPVMQYLRDIHREQGAS